MVVQIAFRNIQNTKSKKNSHTERYDRSVYLSLNDPYIIQLYREQEESVWGRRSCAGDQFVQSLPVPHRLRRLQILTNDASSQLLPENVCRWHISDVRWLTGPRAAPVLLTTVNVASSTAPAPFPAAESSWREAEKFGSKGYKCVWVLRAHKHMLQSTHTHKCKAVWAHVKLLYKSF